MSKCPELATIQARAKVLEVIMQQESSGKFNDAERVLIFLGTDKVFNQKDQLHRSSGCQEGALTQRD